MGTKQTPAPRQSVLATWHLRQVGREMAAGQQGSLIYELLSFFNVYYLYVWLIFEFIFIYKGLNLPYPQSIIAGEIIMVFLLATIDRMRLFMSSLGNKTERLGPIVGAVILGAFAIAGYCYFIRLQVYVLRLEIIVSAIGLGLVAIGFLASIGLIIKFSKNRIV